MSRPSPSARLVDEWSRGAGADGTVAALEEHEADARRAVQSPEVQGRRLGDAYEAGVLELADFQARIARVKDRRRRAEEELAKAAVDLRRNVELTAIVSTFEGFRGLLCGSPDRDRRSAVAEVTSSRMTQPR